MTGDIRNGKTVYSSKDVSVILNIKESTLRKYALLLQEAGYKFYKNENGQRAYFDKDVIILKKLIEIKTHPDMTLKQAVNAAMTWVKNNDVSHPDMSVITGNERYNERYADLVTQFEEFKKQQELFNKELLHRLERQLEKQNEFIEKRDHQLMTVLREIQETKRMLAAAEEKTKKRWWQFWK